MAAGASQRPPEGSPCHSCLACSLGLRKTLGVQTQGFLRCSRNAAGHASSPSCLIAAVNSFARSSVRCPQCSSACSLVHGSRQPAQNIPLLSSTKPHVLIAITRPSFGNCAPLARTDSQPVSTSAGNCAPLARTYSAPALTSAGNCAPSASTDSSPVTSASFGNCAPLARTDSSPVTCASFGNCAPSARTDSSPVTCASFGNCAPSARTDSSPGTCAGTRQGRSE